MALDWDDFSGDDYLPFATWHQTKTIFDEFGQDSKIIYCEILSQPIKFTNKFGKEQYKVEIQGYNPISLNDGNFDFIKENTPSYLAGGIRLMMAIKSLIKTEKTMSITRIGKGFDTEYFAKTWNPTIQTDISDSQQKTKPQPNKNKRK